MAQQVSENDFKRQFLQTWARNTYNAGTLDAAVATHNFYTGPSNFINPTLFQTDKPIQARVAYLQRLNQATRVDPATLHDIGLGLPPMSTALSAYRKVANPNEALVYEQQQNLEIPVDADENTLVELQANASEFVLVGPSSAIVEVRMEHLDVANVNPFTEERQPIARYYVKSYATNSWALCAVTCTEGEFLTLYYPTLDSLLSLLAGTRVSFNTAIVPFGQLPPGMTLGMEYFMFIQALGIPAELRQANGEMYQEYNSPSNEALFQ